MHSTPLTTPMPVTRLAPTVKSVPDGRRRRQLEERGVAIEQQLDPLPRQQLAAGTMALDVLLAPAAPRFGENRFEPRNMGFHGHPIGDESLTPGVES